MADARRFVPHYRIIEAAPSPRAESPGALSFVLHGALGSGQNFSRFIQRLSQERPAYRYVLVDLRHHGDSRDAPAPNTLAACAADLRVLGEHLGRAPDLLIGHSFGGKVALEYARQGSAELRQVWVLDAVPG